MSIGYYFGRPRFEGLITGLVITELLERARWSDNVSGRIIDRIDRGDGDVTIADGSLHIPVRAYLTSFLDIAESPNGEPSGPSTETRTGTLSVPLGFISPGELGLPIAKREATLKLDDVPTPHRVQAVSFPTFDPVKWSKGLATFLPGLPAEYASLIPDELRQAGADGGKVTISLGSPDLDLPALTSKTQWSFAVHLDRVAPSTLGVDSTVGVPLETVTPRLQIRDEKVFVVIDDVTRMPMADPMPAQPVRIRAAGPIEVVDDATSPSGKALAATITGTATPVDDDGDVFSDLFSWFANTVGEAFPVQVIHKIGNFGSASIAGRKLVPTIARGVDQHLILAGTLASPGRPSRPSPPELVVTPFQPLRGWPGSGKAPKHASSVASIEITNAGIYQRHRIRFGADDPATSLNVQLDSTEGTVSMRFIITADQIEAREAAGANDSITLHIRTSRAWRMIDLGVPPLPIRNATGGITNATVLDLPPNIWPPSFEGKGPQKTHILKLLAGLGEVTFPAVRPPRRRTKPILRH